MHSSSFKPAKWLTGEALRWRLNLFVLIQLSILLADGFYTYPKFSVMRFESHLPPFKSSFPRTRKQVDLLASRLQRDSR
jgi:hypothetical protein